MVDVQFFIDADPTAVNQRNSVYVTDDFHGTPGDLNWQVSGAGAATDAVGTGLGQDFAGETQLATTGSTLTSIALYLSGFPETKLQTMECVFTAPATITSVTMRVGALDDVALPTHGFAIEFDTSLGDTAMSLVKWVGGVRTVAATLAIVANHVCRMNWSRTGSGAGTLSLNDLTAATSQTANLTGLSSVVWLAGAYLKTQTGSQRTMVIDWFQATLSGMAR